MRKIVALIGACVLLASCRGMTADQAVDGITKCHEMGLDAQVIRSKFSAVTQVNCVPYGYGE